MGGDIDYRTLTSSFLNIFVRERRNNNLNFKTMLLQAEVEYIAIFESCKEGLWMKMFLQETGKNPSLHSSLSI